MPFLYKLTTRREPVGENTFGPTITNARGAADFAHEVLYSKDCDLWREIAVAIYLDKERRVIGYEELSVGSPTTCTIDVRVICRTALDVLATSVVHVHNHPSGNPTPGRADILMAKRIGDALKCIDVHLLDMVIIGDKEYYSFADEKSFRYRKNA